MSATENRRRPLVVCVGGSTVDVSAQLLSPQLLSDSSNPVTTARSFGGVARNIADALSKTPAGLDVRLITAVGGVEGSPGQPDTIGAALLGDLRAMGVGVDHTLVSGAHSTATYIAVLNPGGELVYGFADCGIIEAALTPEHVTARLSELPRPIDMIVIDANLSCAAMQAVAQFAIEHSTPLWLEPTSPEKFRRAFPHLAYFTYISPSATEHDLLRTENFSSDALPQVIFRTKGSLGVDIVSPRSEFPPLSLPAHALPAAPVSVTGAGDCLVAGCIAYLLSHPTEPRPSSLRHAALYGMQCASASIVCASPVPASLPPMSPP